MKQFDASIMTFNLDRVKEELSRLGVNSMTVSEARSVGRTDGLHSSGSAVSTAAFLPRIQVRVAVPDHLADTAEEILRGGA